MLVDSADEYVKDDYDMARCCYKLLGSDVFTSHKEYVRKQFVHTFIEARSLPLRVTLTFLGRGHNNVIYLRLLSIV
jgi:hypothetical protein